jgi:hypothetical protein
MAKLAEQAERYDDMVAYMNRIVELGVGANDLSIDERNLLSVGYKNNRATRRTAWRTANQFYERDMDDGKPTSALDEKYMNCISEEVFELIAKVKKIVEQYIKDQNDIDPEVVVFFKKMEGDYNRYGAEVAADDKKEQYKTWAKSAYEEAEESAQKLQATNPIRLGLALNFSVFFYEICGEKQQATELAKKAFDGAIDNLSDLVDEEYKDSTLIMQLLKDNLTLWNTDNENDEDEQIEEY